jgi:putative transferase (TIGR04331 family)
MPNISRLLITTADERTWEVNKPILFLGEWCRRYNRKELWSKLNAIVARPYGITREQKEKDYLYIRKIKGELLEEISQLLNKYNGKEYSPRYWDIILGHWLHRYVAVLFNRYFTIKQALEEYRVDNVSILASVNYHLATPDSMKFIWACDDDEWNNILYGKIIPYLPEYQLEVNKVQIRDTIGYGYKNPPSDHFKRSTTSSLTKSVKNCFNRILMLLQSLVANETNALIIASYLPSTVVLKLLLRLRQFPVIWKSPKINIEYPNRSLREKLIHDYTTNQFNGFEKCVRELMLELLPTCFLEGYRNLQEQVLKLSWPKHPKFIFTSNSFDSNELFKLYTAKQVEDNKAPYIIGQHGNNYGTYKYNYCELECVSKGDFFITWGWKGEITKYIPAFIFKTINKERLTINSRGGLLLIEMCLPNQVESWDIYPEYQIYQDQQFEFIECLPKKVANVTTVRLQSRSSKPAGWFEEIRWKERYPSLEMNNGEENLSNLMARNRLIVHSYDSTGILETLALNIPTLCCWPGGLEHLTNRAVPFYEFLVKAELLHFSPESIAKKIESIWENIPEWWNSNEVQEARILFCSEYARTTKKPVKEMNEILTKITSNNECDKSIFPKNVTTVI